MISWMEILILFVWQRLGWRNVFLTVLLVTSIIIWLGTTEQSLTYGCKTGGVIAFFLRKGIIFEVMEAETICTEDIEICVVKLSANGNKIQIFIVLYRPPGGSVTNAIKLLTGGIEHFNILDNRTEYVILRDLNIDYLDKKCNQLKSLKGIEKQFGLSQIISDPARVTPKKIP